MSRNKIVLIGFALLIISQISVPLMMIVEREIVINTGKEYKFMTAPVDPYDPFRGKYITLSYSTNQINLPSSQKWEYGETVYVQFKEDKDGFAVIKSVSKSAPKNTSDYLETTVSSYRDYDEEQHTILHVVYPFNRFYMEESKALEAEQLYWELNQQDWSESLEDDEEWSWSIEEWNEFIDESNRRYAAIQDSTLSIESFSQILENYRYSLKHFSNLTDLYLYEFKFSELAEVQKIINEFDYQTIIKEELVKEEIVEEKPEDEPNYVYSLVSIKNGRAVLKNVIFNDVAIKDAVNANREQDVAH